MPHPHTLDKTYLIDTVTTGHMHIALTHWGRVTRMCADKLTTIGLDDGLSPGRYGAIIRTNAGLLLIGSFGTNFREIFIEIDIFSFKKIHLKMAVILSRPKTNDEYHFNSI